MGTLNKIEDLKMWVDARELCSLIYSFTQRPDFSKDFSLTNQIDRSSGSVMDNIAEGFDRMGNREFIQFLAISKGSCAEVKSQAYRAFDRKHISNEELNSIISQTESIGKQITGFIQYLKKSENKGNKFQEPIVEYR